MAREYKDKFTLDGRVRPVLGVSPTKVKAVEALLERHLRGDAIASATLKEALTSSDAAFNFAHLATLNFLPNYDVAERQWKKIAGTRPVPDFKPVTLYSLNRSWTDGNGASNVLSANGVHGGAPTIPEGQPYPYAYISGDVQQAAGVTKKGFKTDWTLEARINDGINSLDSLPAEMLQVSLDTEEEEVFGALTTQTPVGSALAGGLVPTGATVVPNAKFSRDAIIRAMIEVSARQINNTNIQVAGGWNLLVPIGQALFVNYVLNQTLQSFETNGTAGSVPNFLYQINGGYNPLASVDVIETAWVTGDAWYLMPKPGATKRPVLERLSLRGYETPQLFVENMTGSYVGGGAVSPFEGSFTNDTITLKLRQFGGGIVWDNGAAIVKSSGAGV